VACILDEGGIFEFDTPVFAMLDLSSMVGLGVL
jgi:hypothetical protein